MVAAVVAVAGVAVSAYSSSKASSAAKKGAEGQAGAAMYAADLQNHQYEQTRQDQMPWLEAGRDALTRQQAFLNGDWSGFENAPDYKYAREQGLDTLDHSAAANGGLFGGGADRDRIRFGEGLATQNADNYWNKLAGRAGQGAQTSQNLGALGANMATSVGNQYANAANARASSYQAQANAQSNFANQAGQWGAWYAGQKGYI
jgi:hypothetical protein